MPPTVAHQDEEDLTLTGATHHVLRDPSSVPHVVTHYDTPPVSPVEHSFLTKFFIKHKTYTAFLFVVITAIVFYAVFSSPKNNQETFFVTLGEVKQYVKVSGQVESSKDANLSFQAGGSVAFVGVKIGDIVEQGKVLATLTSGDAQAAILQAEAGLSSTRAGLAQLQQGSRPEELAIKQQVLENAQVALSQSYNALPDAIQNVDATTADTIKNKFAPLFTFSNGRYSLSFSSCDQRLQTEIEEKRTALENTLADFQKKSSVITAISSTQAIDNAFESGYEAAFATNNLVNSISNLLLASCAASNTNLDGYRTSLSLVKVSMTTLFSDITAKRTTLITSKNAVKQASRDLDLAKAGTDPYRIKAQSAAVSQAESRVVEARSGLAKTIIRAPFPGVISSADLSVGENATPGKTVISMIAHDGFEVQAKVPEVDIAKVRIGESVDVTLDAYGKSVIFPATVTRINPTATTEGTVPVYVIIISFIGKDERIKQGMTANVQIVTDEKENVVVVPARFVKIINGTNGQVTTLVSGKETIKEVSVGVRGVDGSFEIRSGLVPGDVLLPPPTTVRQAQKQNS